MTDMHICLYGCRVLGFSLFTKEMLKSLQTPLCYMNHFDVHSLTGNEL